MVVGLVLLGLSWLVANPPAAAPDEPAHYLRAIAVGRFDFIGRPTNQFLMLPTNAAQEDFLHRSTRMVDVPLGLAIPPQWFCIVIDHTASAACLAGATSPNLTEQPTNEGTYQPYLYLPPGLAMRIAGDATTALSLARWANAVVCFALLALAVLVMWDGHPTSLMGLPLTVSPAVVFAATVLGPSGPEIASAICFFAFLVGLSRPTAPARWTWAAGTVAAAVLALSRPLGPLWVVLLIVVAAGLARSTGAGERVRQARAWAVTLAAVCITGSALNLGWQILILPPAAVGLGQIVANVGPSLAAIPEAVGESIGVFGWQDVVMPRLIYGIWGLALVFLLSVALLRGRLHERRIMLYLILGYGAVMVFVSAAVAMPTGFALQGRYVLPLGIALPMVAGEVAHRNRERIGEGTVGGMFALLAIIAAAVQFVGWYSNAHRYAAGANGSWLFAGAAQWSPPGGWSISIGLALVGCVILGAVGRGVRSKAP